MRVVSHTCSNTEIVCALGCADVLVGVDSDSDYPPLVVGKLPQLGRDLDLDIGRVRALKPDLVLTSLTVPGHERIVQGLDDAGLKTLVIDPRSLDDVFGSIRRIATALGVAARGRELEQALRAQMPEVKPRGRRTKVLVEWWPKPVIVPARESWVTDLCRRAGALNPWGRRAGKSIEVVTAEVQDAAPDAVVMSWCGVKAEKYRSDIVARRPGWEKVPAVAQRRIYPVTEAWLGRPGPRLVEGYRALRKIAEEL